MAGELDETGRKLDALAAPLCDDPELFERFAPSLQAFDQIAQIIGEIARALKEPGSAHDALACIRLDAVRMRLARALNQGMEDIAC